MGVDLSGCKGVIANFDEAARMCIDPGSWAAEGFVYALWLSGFRFAIINDDMIIIFAKGSRCGDNLWFEIEH